MDQSLLDSAHPPKNPSSGDAAQIRRNGEFFLKRCFEMWLQFRLQHDLVCSFNSRFQQLFEQKKVKRMFQKVSHKKLRQILTTLSIHSFNIFNIIKYFTIYSKVYYICLFSLLFCTVIVVTVNQAFKY